MQKTLKIKINEKEINVVNEMIENGWVVDSVNFINKIEIKMTKYSGEIQYESYVPLLIYLEIRMLKLMCGKLGIMGYSDKSKAVLISEIEKYKKSEIIKIYNELTKKHEKKDKIST